MSDQWHYRLFGEEFGPVSFDMLGSLIELGTLSEADEVRRLGTDRWVTAGEALQSNDHGGTATATTVDQPENDAHENDAQWYYRLAGQELGPLSFDDLVRFAENGELTADEEVRFGEQGKWRKVGSIGRLVSVLPYRESSALRPEPVAPTESKPAATPVAMSSEPVTPRYQPAAEQPIWSAWIRGAEYGPCTLLQLSEWLASGQLGPTDFIRQGPTGSWLPSASVTQMLASFVLPTAPTPKPTVTAAAPVAAPALKREAAPKRAQEPVPAAKPQPERSAAPVNKVETPPASKPTPKPEPPRVETTPPPEPEPPRPRPAAYTPSAPVAKPAFKPPPKKAAQRSSDGPGLFDALKEPKALIAIGVIALAGLLYFGTSLFGSGNGADKKRLETLQTAYNEFRRLRDSKASPAEFDEFASTTTAAVAPMVKEIDSIEVTNRNTPARQHLLWAARDRLPELLKDARQKPTLAEAEFDKHLHDAAVILGLEKAPPAPPPGDGGDASESGDATQ